MVDERTQDSRTALEWVTCPHCTTTFRVAVPSHYDTLDMVLSEENLRGEGSQEVKCVSQSCQKIFYLDLDFFEEDEDA